MPRVNTSRISADNQPRLFPVHCDAAPFQPGDTITAAYRDRKWNGVVLSVNDARAWFGSIAFSHIKDVSDIPQQDLDAHCDRHSIDGMTSVPVAWEFGKVYWERTGSIEKIAVARND